MLDYVISDNTISVFVKKENKKIKKMSFQQNSLMYGYIKELLTNGKYINSKIFLGKTDLKVWLAKRFKVGKNIPLRYEIIDDTQLNFYYDDKLLSNKFNLILNNVIRNNASSKNLVNFIIKLYKNPDPNIVERVFDFLVHTNLPILESGNFLAYKKINDDFTDVFTSTMDNSVGKVLQMERSKVDNNQNRTCSTGLHVCSFEYLSKFGGSKVVVVEVNPTNVVSIPTDYNNSKMRVCEYKVINDITRVVKHIKPKNEYLKLMESYAQ